MTGSLVFRGMPPLRLARLGIIGSGTIAVTMTDILAKALAQPLEMLAFLATPSSLGEARSRLTAIAGRAVSTVVCVSDVSAFLATQPDLVVECAGHGAVVAHAEHVLTTGIDLLLVSIGCLADAQLHARLVAAAAASGARLLLSNGAIGGVDILSAARLSSISRVVYTSRKPPRAWVGTPAENALCLSNIEQPAVFYTGNAREAARDYPKNANVAATVALAGIGFERTEVRLVADPSAPGNVHEFEFWSECANVSVRIVGKPSPDNPKTSLSTAYAVAREVINRIGPQSI